MCLFPAPPPLLQALSLINLIKINSTYYSFQILQEILQHVGETSMLVDSYLLFSYLIFYYF